MLDVGVLHTLGRLVESLLAHAQFVLQTPILLSLPLSPISLVVWTPLLDILSVFGRTVRVSLVLLSRLCRRCCARRRKCVGGQCKRIRTQLIEVAQSSQFVDVQFEVLDRLLNAYLLCGVSVNVHWREVFSFLVIEVLATFVRDKPSLLFFFRETFLLVNPFDCGLSRGHSLVFGGGLRQRTHLGVDEGVSQQQFLTGVRWVRIRELIPLA